MSDHKPPLTPQELAAMEHLLAGVQSQLGPSADFTARMQKRLERHYALMQERGDLQEVGIPTKRGFFSFFGTHAYSVLTAFTFVLFTGGLSTFAYTSDSITNGTALYPIKRGLESIERTFAGTPEAQAEYHMKLLSRRLAESRFLTLRGVVDEPTNEEVSLVVNDGIQAIQAVQQVDYRDQLLDRITALLRDEEQRIYDTAGIPLPAIEETFDKSSSTSSPAIDPSRPSLGSDTSSAARADIAAPLSTEDTAGMTIQQTSPDHREFSRREEEMRRGANRTQNTELSLSKAMTSEIGTLEENVAVPLHVRPGVMEALQKNRLHLKKIEHRVQEMRRRR